MTYTFETTSQPTPGDIEAAAALTAAGFGRENNQANYDDTSDHLMGVDAIQFARQNEQLAAFAAYRRKLWRTRD